jgi:hypothetical protein
MKFRALRALAVSAVTLSFPLNSWAQTPASQNPAPPPAQGAVPNLMPAEFRAYLEASRQSDPVKRAAALERFIADNPNSPYVGAAHDTLLAALIKADPQQTDRILAQAGRMIAAASGAAQARSYSSAAEKFREADILPDKAEEFAARGLALQREEAAKAMRQTLRPSLLTLGRVYLKRGKLKEAEQALKEAYGDGSGAGASETAAALAELFEKRGKTAEALEYLMTAAVGGRIKRETREKLETLYRQTHKGSLDGLEEELDARYAKVNVNPVKVTPYRATPARTNRVVLAEVFSGAGCAPCVAADLAFDAFLERYTRRELAVLMYHLHVPIPDPMTNPSSLARGRFYGVSAVPSFAVDGDGSLRGGGTREMTPGVYERVRPMIERRLERSPQADLQLTAAREGGAVKVKAVVDKVNSESPALRLHVALAEERLRYTGENGVRFHPMVVRSLAGEKAEGFAVNPNGATAAEWTFDLKAISDEIKAYLDDFEKQGLRGDAYTFTEKKYEINPQQLVVVAFVQDAKTKSVLQAQYVKVGESGKARERESGGEK